MLQNIYRLLSKREKKIKKIHFSKFILFNYKIILIIEREDNMNEEKKWMLMTYYCPTHGDSGMIKPIEITKKEFTKTFQKKDITFKN